MNKVTLVLSALLTAMLMISPVWAAKSTAGVTMHHATMSGSTYTAKQLRGMPVFNQAGKEIGVIHEANVTSGNIDFVTITKNNDLAKVEAYAIPINALKISVPEKKVTLLFAEDKLEPVPSRIGICEADYLRNMQEHYGVATVTQQMAGKKETMGGKY